MKGLINFQNIDFNESLKWCLVKYLHPADHPARIDKDFVRKLDFYDRKCPAKN